jgi:hypothetical protein
MQFGEVLHAQANAPVLGAPDEFVGCQEVVLREREREA